MSLKLVTDKHTYLLKQRQERLQKANNIFCKIKSIHIAYTLCLLRTIISKLKK
jgi:hypothetical protein